jgi:hypothetical protein
MSVVIKFYKMNELNPVPFIKGILTKIEGSKMREHNKKLFLSMVFRKWFLIPKRVKEYPNSL